jgi:hypothetical protein
MRVSVKRQGFYRECEHSQTKEKAETVIKINFYCDVTPSILVAGYQGP